MFSSNQHFILEFFHLLSSKIDGDFLRDTVMQPELDSYERIILETKPIIVIFWDGGGWGGGLQIVNVFVFHPCVGKPKTLFSRHCKKKLNLPTVSAKRPGDSTDALSNWAHSEGHPHTEGTFARTLVNVGDLHRHSGECQEDSREYGVEGSPNFARLRQSSHEGARMLLVHHGTCLMKGKVYPEKHFGATSAKCDAPLLRKELSATSQQLTYFNFSV